MTILPDPDAVLVRYGDISTKSSRVRRMMEDQLLANIEWALGHAGIDARVEREWSRPVVIPDRPTVVADATRVVSDTIGVVSTSPCKRVVPEREAILEAVSELVDVTPFEGRFAIDVNRADKSLPFTSMELEREAGSIVFETVSDPDRLTVDLEDPTTTIHIEVRSNRAYLFTEIIEGPGGLPVGSQAPCVALISGGIDSPVAAYRIMRRGSPIVPVYIDLGPFSGPDHQARALESIATLRVVGATTARPAYLVPGGEFVTDLVDRVGRGRMLVLRRFMFRVADRIGAEVDAKGIVTGEALGQKSSQTASNLFATTVTDRPIHRPVIALDKNEITKLAEEIGTYESATIDAGCPSVAPNEVATQSSPAEIDDLEPADIEDWVDDAVSAAEVIDVETIEGYLQSPDTPAP